MRQITATMVHSIMLFFMSLLIFPSPLLQIGCDAAFVGSSWTATLKSARRHTHMRGYPTEKESRVQFLESLDLPYELNKNNPTSTNLLQKLVHDGLKPGGNNLSNPGKVEMFAAVAPGTWKVVYAPHMTIAAGLLKVHGSC